MCSNDYQCGLCDNLEKCGFHNEARELCKMLSSEVSGKCNHCNKHTEQGQVQERTERTEERAYDPFTALFTSFGWR